MLQNTSHKWQWTVQNSSRERLENKCAAKHFTPMAIDSAKIKYRKMRKQIAAKGVHTKRQWTVQRSSTQRQENKMLLNTSYNWQWTMNRSSTQRQENKLLQNTSHKWQWTVQRSSTQRQENKVQQKFVQMAMNSEKI